MENMRCHEEVYGYDTAGLPLENWKCYCGTTACLQNTNFKLQDIGSIEVMEEKRIDELTQEEEKAFYKKVFK